MQIVNLSENCSLISHRASPYRQKLAQEADETLGHVLGARRPSEPPQP